MDDVGVRRAKRLVARTFSLTGVSSALLRAQSLVPRGYVRVVNYHGTPPEHAARFEAQVAWLAAHFAPVTEAALDDFFRTGRWGAPKPGIIVSFDDGLRSNYAVAAPTLERHGLVGWFFVPVGFIDTPPEAQRAFAEARQVQVDHAWPDGRLAMSWDELRALSRRHVIGSHTRSHLRLGSEVAPAALEDEIVRTRDDLAAHLGKPANAFCWVGGEESSYSAEAARVVRRAGYRYAFMTNNAPIVASTDPLQLQRTNLEASWSLDVLRFQLSGVMDAAYAPKRERVNRLTAR